MENLNSLDGSSKVWIYQSDREFSDEEIPLIKERIFDFTQKWVSHNQNLKSYGNLFHKRMVALIVDETHAGASGCSIDSSVHFMQALGHHFNADFFNRMLFSYIIDDIVTTVNAEEFRTHYKQGLINDDTLVFDHLVKTKDEFLNSWLKPLKESWLSRFV